MTFHPLYPQYAWVKAGVIDQTNVIQPGHESWRSRKVTWAEIDVERSFEENTKM
jgi:hypothetical protein